MLLLVLLVVVVAVVVAVVVVAVVAVVVVVVVAVEFYMWAMDMGSGDAELGAWWWPYWADAGWWTPPMAWRAPAWAAWTAWWWAAAA